MRQRQMHLSICGIEFFGTCWISPIQFSSIKKSAFICALFRDHLREPLSFLPVFREKPFFFLNALTYLIP